MEKVVAYTLMHGFLLIHAVLTLDLLKGRCVIDSPLEGCVTPTAEDS